MTLFWPGESRAGQLFGDTALVTAIVRVEQAWLDTLIDAGVAPAPAAVELAAALGDPDLPELATRAEAGGNPVIPLVELLRERTAGSGRPDAALAAAWLHSGLTSQDTLDSALMLLAGQLLDVLHGEVRRQLSGLIDLASAHRNTPMMARTLTQFAAPYTFGAKAASWLRGVLDAAQAMPQLRATLPVQAGGAVGTRAATAYLLAACPRAVDVSVDELVAAFAQRLGLLPHAPWHTTRAPLTRIGDALVGFTDAWTHIANDVLTASRPEIGELSEPAGPGRGGSSAMPHKVNPVLSTLVRRAGLAAPLLGAQLHLAAADAGDERPAGAWHTEWQTISLLARRTAAAASQTSELVCGVQVHTQQMAMNVQAAGPDATSERRALASRLDLPDPDLAGSSGSTDMQYMGQAGELVDRTCAAARGWLAEHP